MKNFLLGLIAVIFLASCSKPPREEAQLFLDDYTAAFLDLYYKSAEAEWAANTKIVASDTSNAFNVQQANEAFAQFTGSVANISSIKSFLEKRSELEPIQIKQLETMLYAAANNPGTIPEIVSARIKAEAAQNELLFGYDFQIDGQSVTTNDLDEILSKSVDLAERQTAWETSKGVGLDLREGLTELKSLRNGTVSALGFDDFFAYQVSDYGMTTDEMIQTCDQLVSDIWPLYRELHTYARYELAEKFEKDVPEMLPAHWLTNRWGQDWSAMIDVEGLDLDGVLEAKGSQWLIEQSERFYISLGFDPLPNSFYELSSLYPLPEDANYKKNNHASAWHLDLKNDLRSLMSVKPNSEWYETTHHELGHIYYYMEYTNPQVPPLLRGGANRAFHEAVGSMMGLAAMQEPFLDGVGLIDGSIETDETQTLLKEALNYVVFIPWSAGVMTHFEKELYSTGMTKEEYNKSWWGLKAKYQGIVPPTERGGDFCDAASKTHINNDAAQYYDYALSFALLFQLHDHIATNILEQDPRATNYYGNKDIGQFLHEILSVGATKDWRELLKETTGEGINAKAMLNYFSPLMEYLQAQNEGRAHTLPENI